LNNSEALTRQAPVRMTTEKRLHDSDVRYFQAAAETIDVMEGKLSYMQNLSSQAGGCVFHSLTKLPEPNQDACKLWLTDLEQLFVERDVPRCRFYLQEEFPEHTAWFESLGYKKVPELGLFAELDMQEQNNDIAVNDFALAETNAEHWALYKALLETADATPDGYRMQADDYATLERAKAESGYMQAYIYIVEGEALAVGNLDYNNSMARVKNVLVHPQQRGKGIGKKVVATLMEIGRQQGAKQAGAYALEENLSAVAMYHSLGFKDVYFQYEWTHNL
jgi:ribosomal protein S18 acetylase RimI-like enzyme